MNYGIIPAESFPDYLSTDCVGSHRLEDLMPYPIRYYLKYISHELPERLDTPAFRFGRKLHALALEGEDIFNSRYCVVPADAPERPTEKNILAKKKADSTLEKIAWWAAFMPTVGNRELIDEEDEALARAMVKAIRTKPVLASLFEEGQPEVTFRHKMAHFGIQSRVDWFNPKAAPAPLIVDLKSIDQLEDFDDQYLKFGYYKQAAFYRLVVGRVIGIPPEHIQFSFAVVEKRPPYLTEKRDPDADSLAIGQKAVLRDLAILRNCYETGVWPGSSEEAKSVSLPEWMVNKLA